jgi:L-fuculose-phosphate aldolase
VDDRSAEGITAAIIEIGRLMFDRFLTDAAGGNMSVRSGERIYLTPRHAGEYYHWHLRPDLVNVVDGEHTVLAGPALVSREAAIHFALYDAFPRAGAIIHAHPRNLMVFAAAGQPMPPVLEYTQQFGIIGLTPYAVEATPELAAEVLAYMQGRAAEFERAAQAVLLPGHGIVVMAHDLLEAYDTLERLELNARCVLLRANLPALEGTGTRS